MVPRSTISGVDHLTSRSSAHAQDMPPAFLCNVRMRNEVSSVRDQLKESPDVDRKAADVRKDTCTVEDNQVLVSTDGGVGNHGCGSKNLSLEVSTESSQILCDSHDACSRGIGQNRAQSTLEADTTNRVLVEEVQSL